MVAWVLLLGGIWGAPARSADESDLLDVQDAFKLSTQTLSRERVALRWDIADGYYLYRDRIKVKTTQPGVALGALNLPEGEQKHDEFLGDVVVYHHQAEATQDLSVSDPALTELELNVSIQGCHEEEPKICYPPFAEKLRFALPAAVASAVPTASPVLPATPAPNVLGGAPTLEGATDALPLPEDEAFRFEAIAQDDNSVLARFTMPPGYYLYRDKTSFLLQRPNDTQAQLLPRAPWPPGVDHEDEHFGKVVVYYGTVEVPLPLNRIDPAAQRVTVTSTFQGCEEDGICYPPMTRTVTVDVPAARGALTPLASGSSVASVGSSPEPVAEQSEQDQLTQSLIRGDSRWWTLLTFFALGLALAFTPCVFPMIPILSGIIAGAGENLTTRRAIWLSLVYVLASSVLFTVAGIIAGLTGQNLQAALQKPAVLIAFAAVFVAMAVSMFGFYELQMPGWLQNRISALSNKQKAGSTVGVAVMGLLSALLVGPCVAPPLAAAVVYIGQQRDPLLGGAALFLLSLGMGAPLVVFGATAGRLLPRAGAWMNAVKAVFGVIFLWLALWMLERVLDPEWVMLLAGMLLVSTGVYLGALDHLPHEASGWRKLWKAMGFAMLVLGVLQFIGLASGGRDWLKPLSGLRLGAGGAAASEATFAPVRTADELDRAIAQATAQGKPVLFDFYADWCVACKEMERYTFSDTAVQQRMRDYVALKIDVTDQDTEHVALQKRYGIIGPPATLFFSCRGDENKPLRLIGFEKAEAFAQRLQRANVC
jgi:thiol:disulfide interchange protein DsbD